MPNETAPLRDVVVKHVRDAFVDDARIASEWRDLNFLSPPSFDAAVRECDAFLEALEATGATVRRLPRRDGAGVGLDAIYARDATVMSPAGMVLCGMGKPQRRGEPRAQGDAFLEWGIPVAGAIDPPACLEGGDVVWLDERTVAVGRGYRTNDAGIAAFRALAGPGVDVIVVPLPHWRGAGDVFHLMSIISPVDDDLAVVYSPLVPVPFRERLLDGGYTFVEVPDEEFASMGANVLALAPRRVLMVDGNPRTRRLLEQAGAEVIVYSGVEISMKGGGGPTCLTRPIVRSTIQNRTSTTARQ
jgi:N-dimethylarginine dimethylaminohydrolase